MSEHYIINDCDLVQIKDSELYPEAIQHFLENVVYVHPNKGVLLRNLSDLYVLVARKEDKKDWENIMNEREYQILNKNHQLVISYMLTNDNKKSLDIHYIDWIDTIVRHQNLSKVMIDKYQILHNVLLVPQEIIPSSVKYWAKILDFGYLHEDLDEYIVVKDLIEEYISELGVKKTELKWDPLYELVN